jgi:hypothetical protein
MTTIKTQTGDYIGPFKQVDVLADRLRCDNTDLPYTVIGTYEFVDDAFAPAPPEPPVVVPVSVSPRQIRQALTAAGLRADVEAAILEGDQDLKDWWEFATAFERNHPLVTSMAASLDVSDEQLDALFIAAGAL